jgi:hypothetical protein
MMNRIISIFLIIIFFTKIIIWLTYDAPIGRLSMVLIIVLLAILNIKTRLMWGFGLLVFVCGLFCDFLKLSHAGVSPFYFTESILNPFELKTNDIVYRVIRMLPFILYIILIITFLTKKHRIMYGIQKKR